ncbi:phosphatase PAP2 family protein [Thiohalophilus sp.]|uniref:phosphatase PAP2 family protein n=1 Tax=Thiohalophilus sp. TaxID=3028392 RepID=UPI0039751768
MNAIRQSLFIKRMVAFELALCGLFNRASHIRFIKSLFAFISRLGDGIFWYTLIALLPLIYGSEALGASLHMAIVGALALGLYKAIKSVTERPRPCVVKQDLLLGTAPLDQYSFPSGHTMHAVSFTLVALHYYPELAVILLPFTALVALSRVVLALHYPTDVLCGALLGGGIALLSFTISG